ncbi:MAG TPA: M15 family metallopeptidase, partial [Blastocatellia bacterium]|nr:M15 family metallopeptidase [Blastocatellia bacterium]
LELKWVFGSRVQQGWSLYAPLIRKVIGAETEIESDGFTRSLARWQTSRGLPATGVVDQQTWAAMVAELQAARIKDRQCASSDDLVIAPASEFYDSERSPELRQVDRDAYRAYKRMIAAAAKDRTLNLRTTESGDLEPDEPLFKIISAFRSREYQEHLRRSAPHAGRAALAVNSPHFTGRALDLYVGGEPVSTRDSNRRIQTATAAYKWLVKNASRFGFRPYFFEPWHWEYVP